MSQLFVDCIIEILEHLERDKITLHSCLLVNRIWCKISVKILWRSVWNFNSCNYNILISCLPDESKEILIKNGIIISALTSKPPMFNYASFCKVLSDYHIIHGIGLLLENQKHILTDSNIEIIAQEIYKLLMNQSPSLKILHVDLLKMNIILTSYPGSKNCLKYLSELNCRSNFYPEFFHQLSKICHNIKSIYVVFDYYISDGLMDLIFSQNNLKNLVLHQSHDHKVLSSIIPSLAKLSNNTLIKLGVYEIHDYVPLPFPKNLHELILSFYYDISEVSEDAFKELQHIEFPKLQVLRFRYACPKVEFLINFLEKNGENLKELYVENEIKFLNSLNLAISKFCPNLKILSTSISDYDNLKVIFERCQHLESIKLYDKHLNLKELLNIIIKYSPKNFFQLKIYYDYQIESQLFPELLNYFYTNWGNRLPLKSFSWVIIDYLEKNNFVKNHEIMKIIENFINLEVIKKFKVIDYDENY
ncbi:hypothetical protein RhiirA4_467105 [Rhizophagus irregularis]|uniref:F-box domain-containing protein n=1 Tax=Rhizophagus irregularis TaxID=588596 RepID=A0A2I1GVJ9_9GLOM|nr:hypothetical protein RhiirA4_467105 [Rhizophagus irregularis]